MPTRRQFLEAAIATALATTVSPLLADGKSRGFKIGVCDWMVGKSFDPASLQTAAHYGLDGVMVSFGGPGGKHDLRDEKTRAAFTENAGKFGAVVSSIGMGILNSIPYKSEQRTDQWVSDAIDVAAVTTQAKVILLAFFGKGDLKNDPAGTKEVIRKLKEVAPRAEKLGVKLGVESWLSADEHLFILDSVASPAVQVYYDIGNSTKMGYDVPKEIRQLGKRICEFHAKDYAAKGFGNGDIDFWQVRKAMDDIDYKGWIQLEGPSPFGLQKTYQHDARFLKALFPA